MYIDYVLSLNNSKFSEYIEFILQYELKINRNECNDRESIKLSSTVRQDTKGKKGRT